MDGKRGVPEPLATFTAGLFRALSALRGKRIVHPDGVGFAATFSPTGTHSTGAGIFDERRRRDVVVRLSRATGLPEPLPDVLGLAIRLPDAHGVGCPQDFLLVSSGARPLARHLLLPSGGFLGRPYSSLLPYRVRGGPVLVGALPMGVGPGPGLAELRRADAVSLRFRLAFVPLRGRWTEVADLVLEKRLPDDEGESLRFDPSNTGGGIELAGLLNQLRRPAYRGSQDGRGER